MVKKYPIINIMVDTQLSIQDTRSDGSTVGMTSDGQRRFLESSSAMIEKLRQQGIPTVWVTIGDKSAFHPSVDAWRPDKSPRPKSDTERQEQGFYGHKPPENESEKRRVDGAIQKFRFLISKNGPRRDEAVLQKRAFDSFSPDDSASKDLLKFLKDVGCKKITLMGGNADVCVSQTALGAVRNKFQAMIFSDLVVSDDNPNWNKKKPKQYERMMRAVLGKEGQEVHVATSQEFLLTRVHPSRRNHAVLKKSLIAKRLPKISHVPRAGRQMTL